MARVRSPRDQLITRAFPQLVKTISATNGVHGEMWRNTRSIHGTSLEVTPTVMRKRYRVLLLAALVAAFIVPVGFALSLDSAPVATPIVRVGVVSPKVFPPWSAWPFVVGTILFGLAAAVRKTS
jgi:hypothetical protein